MRWVELMEHSLGFKIYSLLSVLERKHGMLWADGLHRQVFMAVLEAQLEGKSITNQQLVELEFTSRSSTYRKIGDLKQLGFISEKWEKGSCYLELGPTGQELLNDAGKNFSALIPKSI